jgi:hypothetical protein
LRRGKGRRESAAERKARDHFNETVKAWPCFFTWNERPCGGCDGLGEINLYFCGQPAGPAICPECRGDGKHHCSGRKDAHHLLPKQFIRRRLSDWPEDELLAVLFNPLIGAPLCRAAHEAVEARTDFIHWDELNPECITYVSSLPDFMLLRLEEECPKRSLAGMEQS